MHFTTNGDEVLTVRSSKQINNKHKYTYEASEDESSQQY